MAHKARGMKYNVVEEYVPCVHAKPKNGKPGLHKVKVVFDSTWAIKTATCTCLEEHGVDAVLALHQTGLEVCYSQVVKILDFAFKHKTRAEYQKYQEARRWSSAPDPYANNNLIAAASITTSIASADTRRQARETLVFYTEKDKKKDLTFSGRDLASDVLARTFSGVSGVPCEVSNGPHRYLHIRSRSIAMYDKGAWVIDGDLDTTARRLASNLNNVVRLSNVDGTSFCFVCCKTFDKKFDDRHKKSEGHAEMLKLRILAGLKASTAKGRKLLKAKGPMSFLDKSIHKNMNDNAADYDRAIRGVLTDEFMVHYRPYVVAGDVQGAIHAMRRTTLYDAVVNIPDFKLIQVIHANYKTKEMLSNVWNFQDQG